MNRIRVLLAIFGILLSVVFVCAADDAVREAEQLYQDGQRLSRDGRMVEAFEAYKRAAETQPDNAVYTTAREVARQRAAFAFASQGVQLAGRKQYAGAVAAFERALTIDPANQFTRQELARIVQLQQRSDKGGGVLGDFGGEAHVEAADQGSAGPVNPPVAPPDEPPPLELAPTLRLQPRPGARTIDLRGDTRTLFLALGAEFGIQFTFDSSVPARTARLRIENGTFEEAVRLLTAQTGTLVAPIAPNIAIVAASTPENRARYERAVVRQFRLEQTVTAQEVNEIVQALRNILEMRLVMPSSAQHTITVRDTASKVEEAAALIDSLTAARPQVLLELETIEVRQTWDRELGLSFHPQTALFKLNPLDKVQSGVAVPLPQVFGAAPPVAGTAPTLGLASFGGGRTRFGITLPGVELRAALDRSTLRSISRLTVRAGEGQPSVFLIGSKYPILNASFGPIVIDDEIRRQQQAGTLITPFPSFTFEDLGIKLRVTPRIHSDREITLKIEAQARSLTGESLNDVPVISNRETDQVVRVVDGQPTLITGMIARDERTSLSGTPFLSQVPVLGYLFGVRSDQAAQSEIMLVLTPHVMVAPPFTGGAFAVSGGGGAVVGGQAPPETPPVQGVPVLPPRPPGEQ